MHQVHVLGSAEAAEGSVLTDQREQNRPRPEPIPLDIARAHQSRQLAQFRHVSGPRAERMVTRFEANIMTPNCRTRVGDQACPRDHDGCRGVGVIGPCRAHNVPSTTENRGQHSLLSTSKATHKPPAHHTFGLLNTPVDHQPVLDSQAEYAGSIPVIRSISPARWLAHGPIVLSFYGVKTLKLRFLPSLSLAFAQVRKL